MKNMDDYHAWFRVPAGWLRLPSGRLVDVPMDAVATLNSEVGAVKAIFDRRATLDRTGRADHLLVVLAGETHSIPAHHVHHMLVLDALRKHEDVVFAYESPHDILNLTHDPAINARLCERDGREGGHLALKTSLGFYGTDFADQSLNALFRFLVRNGIPTRFTDAAMLQDGWLARTDPSTAASLKHCFGENCPGILGASIEGMRVRNHHMAKAGVDFAKAAQARILVQQCGNSHIIINKRKRLSGGDNLALQARGDGVGVMVMPILAPDLPASDVSFPSSLSKDEIFSLPGVSGIDAIYDPRLDQPVPGGDAALQNRKSEAGYLNLLLERVGLGHERLTPEEQKSLTSECQREISDAIQLIRSSLISPRP